MVVGKGCCVVISLPGKICEGEMLFGFWLAVTGRKTFGCLLDWGGGVKGRRMT